MSGELKPCPFCGSRAVDLHVTRYEGGERSNKPRVAFYVRCRACRARGPMFKAKGEGFSPISERDHDRQRARAVEAWNRRTERTCSPVFGECSECKYPLHDYARYCSNCGARIKAVDE